MKPPHRFDSIVVSIRLLLETSPRFETSHRSDLIVGSIRLWLQHLCVVRLPVLLEFDGLVAAGGGRGGRRAARAAGGNTCTGGSTDDRRRYELMWSRRPRRWRRGAHARCSSAWCWAQYQPRPRGKIPWRQSDSTWRKRDPPRRNADSFISAGPGAGPTQESRRQFAHTHTRLALIPKGKKAGILRRG